MADVIRIETKQVTQALAKAPREIATAINAAGDESANVILGTVGLRSYPPNTDANLPPTPYYIRGRGMQYASGNAANSERYGSKWTVKTTGYGTTIGNSASYAPRLAGPNQPPHFARIGWRKLVDVATEKLPQITKIFNLWIERAIRRAGL